MAVIDPAVGMAGISNTGTVVISGPGCIGTGDSRTRAAAHTASTIELPPEELARIRSFPASLEEALDALETDRGYLTRDGVFPEHLLDEWVASKRKDIEEMRVVPHPWEVARCYDI